MPKFVMEFKSLGQNAFERSQKGYAALIVRNEITEGFSFAEYSNIEDFNESEQAKFKTENVAYIKDCLEGNLKKLYVFIIADDESISSAMKSIKSKVPRNCWIGIAETAESDNTSIVEIVKSCNKNDNRRYKLVVFKAADPDDMHIVNFTNSKVTFKDSRAEQTGEKAISYLLGLLAGLSLDVSVISKTLKKFESVEEPDDINSCIGKGEFTLINDEGNVKVARGVNSLITLDKGITDDMKFILIVESMDLIFTDIFTNWNNNYKGIYKNNADNQFLFFGAVNSYFDLLSYSKILDPNFSNKSGVNIPKQRMANVPKYGKDKVNSFDDEKIKELTVGTNVYMGGKIKILNAMEDIDISVIMA